MEKMDGPPTMDDASAVQVGERRHNVGGNRQDDAKVRLAVLYGGLLAEEALVDSAL